MRPLSNRNESDSDSDIDIPNNHSTEDSGWNDTIELDLYVKNKNDLKVKDLIIRKANRSVRLSAVIFTFKIEWERTNTPSGWTHKCRCPFPDHNDNRPSFGYNSKDDRFWCFGCQKAGGTVQFLAALRMKDPFDIAKEILSSSKLTESVIVELEDKNFSRNDEMLLEFSKRIHSFLQEQNRSDQAIEHVEKITWNLDMYLQKHAMEGSIDTESLEARLQKLTEKLTEFGG